MLKGATFIAEEKPYKDEAKYSAYRYYVAGVKIDGVDYTAKIVLGVLPDGSLYYDHALTQIEKGALLSLALEEQTPDTSGKGALSGVKDTKLIELLQANSSKVVGKNGDPLVVYRGSPKAGFSVFDNYVKERSLAPSGTHWVSSQRL